jgi:hypothetical protein
MLSPFLLSKSSRIGVFVPTPIFFFAQPLDIVRTCNLCMPNTLSRNCLPSRQLFDSLSNTESGLIARLTRCVFVRHTGLTAAVSQTRLARGLRPR